jgi:hypothetical protein
MLLFLISLFSAVAEKPIQARYRTRQQCVAPFANPGSVYVRQRAAAVVCHPETTPD